MLSTTKPKGLLYSAQDWHPAKFQLKAVKFLLEHAAAGLLLDPGLRKTSITLAALKILKNEGLANRSLVIAPLRVVGGTWPDEIEKWKDFNHFKYVLLHGAHKEELLRESDADIFGINPEGLQWLLARQVIRKDNSGDPVIDYVSSLTKLKLLGLDTLIVDESTKFKNSQSQRSKLLKPALGRFGRRWILTGTPAPNGLLDLFFQMYICDQGVTLGDYITAYRKKYFETTDYEEHNWRIQKGAETKIYKAIKPYVLRLEAGDFIDLPKLLDNQVPLILDTKARKVYTDMEVDLFAAIDNDELTAVSASVAMQKCEQIASGEVYKNIEERTKKVRSVVVHSEKIEALVDLMEQRQGKPTMVLYWFDHERERIEKAFKKAGIGPGAHFTGTVAQGRAIQAQWNSDQLVWLLGQPASMGHGLNLQEGSADALIWYTLPYDLELYEQTWRRLVRSGSNHKTIINHLLLVKDTVDYVKWSMLKAKDKNQQKLLTALKAYRRTKK
jgi:SNF2 family DNA or RNA helicase